MLKLLICLCLNIDYPSFKRRGVWRGVLGELEGIGPLLSKEGLGGWLGQQRSNRKMVIVIVMVIVKNNSVSLCLCVQ